MVRPETDRRVCDDAGPPHRSEGHDGGRGAGRLRREDDHRVQTRGNGRNALGEFDDYQPCAEGTMVKKGDVLCFLDSSRYDESLRLQEIYLGEVRADYTKAELDLQVAKLAVVEYREGLMQQSLTSLKGEIALMRADHQAHRRPAPLGARDAEEGVSLKGAGLDRGVQRRTRRTQPQDERDGAADVRGLDSAKDLKVLEAGVLMAQSIYNYQTSRLAQAEEELQFLKEQVDSCTIKAPHDGFLVYYTYPQAPDFRIKEGITVWRTQKLFYLPDLDRMEVVASLHETVVKDVQPGMKARVTVEGLPGRMMEGTVASVASMPTQVWYSDAKYFESTIKLDNVTAGLKPGMTASVELLVDKKDVLVIPNEALTVDENLHVCYVAREGELLRRQLKIGQSTSNLVEVTEGLEENEAVVLDPASVSVDILQEAVTDVPHG